VQSRGAFITLEGIDGSGKSTQARRLADRLARLGRPVLLTREPGGTAIGEAIREILLADDARGISARTEALLHTAARAEHAESIIVPALNRGDLVISDRFVDSTLAYQGGGSGLPIPDLRELQRFAIGDLEPDLRVLFRLPAKEGMARRATGGKRADRLDQESESYHLQVAACYDELVASDPAGWLVVDALAPETAVADAVFAGVLARLEERLLPTQTTSL
jgi:dTMP kinase